MKLRPSTATPSKPVTLWGFPVALATVIAAGIIVFGLASLFLWLGLDRPVLGASTLDAKDQLDLIRIALIVTGGLGGVIALLVAYRKQRLAEDDNRRENTKAFNERFTTATAQLGNDAAAVRLAGIYSIAGLADDWPQGRRTCIAVLCAYLRMPYQRDSSDPGFKEGERQVRLSIITIIRDHLRLPTNRDSRSWQGQDLDFTGATFDGGDLSGASFTSGTISFNSTNFVGKTFRWDGAAFCGSDVFFSGSTFGGGRISFRHTSVTSGRVSFNRVNFCGAEVSFGGATFSGGEITFGGATFSGGEVSFRGVAMSSGKLSFQDAEFSGGRVPFTWATLSGGEVELPPVVSGLLDFPFSDVDAARVHMTRGVKSDGVLGTSA